MYVVCAIILHTILNTEQYFAAVMLLNSYITQVAFRLTTVLTTKKHVIDKKNKSLVAKFLI